MQQTIPALKVNQWLAEWDRITFDDEQHKAKPKEHFYIFSVKASLLRSLSKIQHRQADPNTRKDEIGIQRKHDKKRSDEIREYIKFGYPWSSLTPANKKDPEFADMQKPGWIPTAIVINILGKNDERRGHKVASHDLITIEDINGISKINLPDSMKADGWEPSDLPPIEVIDGQHRLWAFDKEDDFDFEVPVVAFHELDISWQAYLFWVINIKPKKIDASLAFDMYPLLRDQDWLEKGEKHIIYREARAQELVEILWSYPESPWHKRIEMLGGKREFVSQSAWVRSLVATFIKKWEKTSGRPGGLFGSQMNYSDAVLDWSRAQQAAFLIYCWKSLEEAIKNGDYDWASDIRSNNPKLDNVGLDDAFAGSYSLLNTDQGVRAVLQVFNDIFYEQAKELNLAAWIDTRESSSENILDDVRSNLLEIENQAFSKNIKKLCNVMASFDWRASSEPHLDADTQKKKKAYRGSGGYRELREDVLKHLRDSSEMFRPVASKLLGIQ